MKALTITILADDPKSWIIPHCQRLISELNDLGHTTKLIHDKAEITTGDVLFLLGCVKILPSTFLKLNQNNIIIHESALPNGKGWSPLSWQIEEGKNEIPFTLFEAAEGVDSGPIYLQDYLKLDGTELLNEIKELQGLKTIELCLSYIKQRDTLQALDQQGEESFYPKRDVSNNTLDPYLSIEQQFEKFRTADNELFPLQFDFRGQKYLLKVYKSK